MDGGGGEGRRRARPRPFTHHPSPPPTSSPFQAPVRTAKFAREVPPLPGWRAALPQAAAAGFLPFSAIYIELYYIFLSVWGHKVRERERGGRGFDVRAGGAPTPPPLCASSPDLHHLLHPGHRVCHPAHRHRLCRRGADLLPAGEGGRERGGGRGSILAVLGARAHPCPPLPQAAEDHAWWWRAWTNGASTGAYVAAYAAYHYAAQTDMSGWLAATHYASYTAVACAALAAMLGFVGWRSSLAFVRAIYKAIKCE